MLRGAGCSVKRRCLVTKSFQNIVWQAIATVLFVTYGALDGWAGWLGLAIAVVTWVGLAGLGRRYATSL